MPPGAAAGGLPDASLHHRGGSGGAQNLGNAAGTAGNLVVANAESVTDAN